ncbi:hypothetical protein RU98_GL001633 [Enterococcus caccae]|nr:hypothetical protein RU98_GL001633 [Enterococcus caccae]
MGQKLISEGIASASTVYSNLGCETKVIFTFVPHSFFVGKITVVLF